MASHRVKPYVGKFSTAVLLHLRWTVARSGTCFGSQRNLLSTLASARKLELEEYFMPAIRLTGGSWNEVGANRFEHRFVRLHLCRRLVSASSGPPCKHPGSDTCAVRTWRVIL